MMRRFLLTGALLATMIVAASVVTSTASAELRLLPGSFQAYAANSPDPADPWVGDATDLDQEAGSHPYSLTVAFAFESTEANFERRPGGNVRNVVTELPAGLLGDPTAGPTCPRRNFEGFSEGFERCPVDSQVGTVVIDLGGEEGPEYRPVFNIAAPPDQPALLGFIASTIPVYLEPNVRSDGDYGLQVKVSEVPQNLPVVSAKATIWGVPALPSHDAQRFEGGSTGHPSGAPQEAFLTMPTACEGPLTSTATFESWQGTPVQFGSFTTPTLSGCDRLSFLPSFGLSPQSAAIDSPSGADAELKVPQSENFRSSVTPAVRDVSVTLPKGLTVSPSAANGLQSCSDEQLGYGTLRPAACPDGSRVGKVTVKTPLLAEPLTGSAFIGTPLSNDPSSGQMYRLFLVFEGSGVKVKLRGSVRPDPQTGQLTVTFEKNPQLPFETLALSFFGGPQGVLATPPSCGEYQSESAISSSAGQSIAGKSGFRISVGCGSQGTYAPAFESGVQNVAAGQSSPFTLDFKRADGQLDPSGVTAVLPPGLTGVLAGIPYCSDGALAAASSRSAAAELASSSCPAASRLGSATVGAGPGTSPFYLGGSVYLAGPYKGAPLSLAVIVAAKAGPYDLGDVVVRAAINVDPATAQLRVVSDPLPRILAGVPIRLREVRIAIDRPGFMQSPTSCRRMSVGAALMGEPSITGAGAGSATTANVSSPFQLGSCAALGFSPRLSLRLSGKSRRAANPALKAVLTQPVGQQANLSTVTAVLPKSEFIDPAHVKNPCTRVQFDAGACPPNSILGRARAFTPLLDKPLEGYVYFRSNGGERQLPDLVADLNGQIHIVLVGFIDSVHKKGSTASRVRTTFATVPDAPVSRFVLNLKGGKRGLLQNSTNICRGKHRATVSIAAQNGKLAESQPLLQAACGKSKHRGASKK